MKNIILLLTALIPSTLFAQNILEVNQPIVLDMDTVGVADSLVLVKPANGVQVSSLYITLTRVMTKKELKTIKKQFDKSLRASVTLVSKYETNKTTIKDESLKSEVITNSTIIKKSDDLIQGSTEITNKIHLELAAFYLDESARLDNASLTVGLIGGGVGVGAAFLNPIAGGVVLGVTGIVVIVLKYKSNKMTRNAAKELRLIL